MLLTIDAGSMAIGFIGGFIFYSAVGVASVLLLVNNMNSDERNDALYEKKLREAGYAEDIFE